MRQEVLIGWALGATAAAVAGAVYYFHEKANAAASAANPPGTVVNPGNTNTPGFTLAAGAVPIYVPGNPTTYQVSLPAGGTWLAMKDSGGNQLVLSSVVGTSGPISATYSGVPPVTSDHSVVWLTATWKDASGATQSTTVTV